MQILRLVHIPKTRIIYLQYFVKSRLKSILVLNNKEIGNLEAKTPCVQVCFGKYVGNTVSSRVLKYPKKCFEDLTTFFMPF